MKGVLILSALIIAMLWGCSNVEDIPIKEKNVVYKVEHYQQNTNDDRYTLKESENKTGTTDENTSAQAKTYEGFTAKTVEQLKITADGSTVVKIYYDRNTITLTLDLDGGEGQTEITGKYSTIVNVTAPTKSGYNFAGWNPQLPTIFPVANAAYKATWAKEGDYVIIYNLNGGTNASNNPASYNVETETITLADATKTGYTFGGWYTDEACTEANKVTEIIKGSTGTVILYAKWTVSTDTAYKVEHYQQNTNDDGYTLKESENKTGTTDENTSAQAKTYEGFTAKTVEQLKITADGSTVVKIYYDRNTITLTLDLDGGEGQTEITGKYGTIVNVTAPTKSGYNFAGWNPQLPTTFPVANATYKATWAKEGDYLITYNLNGGTNASNNPASYNVETETITLADATKTGYTFGGWYTDEACTIAKTEIVKGSTGTVILYAKWGLTAESAIKIITELSESKPYDMVIDEDITSDTISTIKTASQNNNCACVNLDLSENTELTTIEDSAFGDSCSLTAFNINENNENYSTDGKILCNKDKTILIVSPSDTGEAVENYEMEKPTIDAPLTVYPENNIPSNLYIIKLEDNDTYDELLLNTSTDVIEVIGGETTINQKILDKITQIPSDTTGNITITAGWKTTADTVATAITALSEEYTHYIIVTGAITNDTISAIKTALQNNSKAMVNLDLSETTGLNELPIYAFSYCNNLTSITIPDSMTEIEDRAFYYCNSLTTVNYKGSQEQWEQISIGSDNECLTNATINYNYTE